MDLLAFERKLDQTIARKRMEIQEAIKKPLTVCAAWLLLGFPKLLCLSLVLFFRGQARVCIGLEWDFSHYTMLPISGAWTQFNVGKHAFNEI